MAGSVPNRPEKVTRKPNFFLIGAPKCGTTALSEYLRVHPQIYFSPMKEPGFFCRDIKPGIADEQAYMDLFSGATDDQVAVGEGTVWYLRSEHAVAEILRFCPSARLIVMLRNPLEMAPALHATTLENGLENVRSFERAWRLQGARAVGRQVPRGRPNRAVFQYGWYCSLGEQVERLFGTAPRDQVHVILYDDFKADTRRCYERVLAFLGLPIDGCNDFGAQNTHRRHRIGLLAEIDYQLRTPPPRLRRLKHQVQHLLGVDSLHIHRIVNRINQTINLSHASRPRLSAAMEAELQDYFAEDLALLSRLLERDLSHWLRGEAQKW